MVGQTVLHYEILEKLGAGGMGDIYKARDGRLNRFVAIKVLSRGSAGDPERRRRFIQEAQAASSLNHPNIITIYDIVRHEDEEFMVMEFLAGKTLGDLIPKGGMGTPNALRYGVQMADALQAAHAVGIIHRDLKPANVMVTDTGLIKILDFGLAKLTDGGGMTSLTDNTQTIGSGPLTVEGSILGTVSYMSPEQAQGKKVDPRSDIFSYGLVLYEVLTGRKAFSADSAVSTLSAILRDEPKPIAEIVSGVPPELEQLIHKALRKDPAERWHSMKEVEQQLTLLKQKSDSAILYQQQLPPARKKSAALPLIVAVVVVVGAAAGGGWWWTHREPAPAATETKQTVADAPPAMPPPNAPAAAPSSVPPVETKPSAVAEPPLTNQSILDLLKGKVSPNVVISHIRSARSTKFDLSTAEIIRLTQAGVPETVIEAMRSPAGAGKQAATASTAGTATVAPSAPAAPPTAAVRPVKIEDRTPLSITLMEDVHVEPAAGQVLHFQVTKDVHVNDALVVARGATVTGEVVEAAKKKFLGRAGKPTFRLLEVTAIDGSKLKIRALPSKRSDGKADRPLEPVKRSEVKEVLAPAGSEFLAYVDGEQTVNVRH